jgi:acyl-CoA synthetase (AMP-forming)/AMP-acid ligase II/acyl carrier protein
MERLYPSVFDAVCRGRDPDKAAIESPDRDPMTYGGLSRQITHTVDTLNDMGYGKGDRIALMLPNGPEMATAFLAVMAGLTCAPLNPLYRKNELEFYLSDMRASAIIVPDGVEQYVPAAARSLGIPAITLMSAGTVAGAFSLAGEKQERIYEPGFAGPEDIALVLHTSGTTSRPKLVPLTQSGIVDSAVHIAEPLGLTGNDKCLNVMPLFHIHGLIGAVITSLVSGGSVVCTPGFSPESMMQWLHTYRPTWYTAVPTIHQHVLKQAVLPGEDTRMSGLRFIRSSSASLPPAVKEGLEEVFRVPVVEAYGMTEAAHQISTNLLPPRLRKPGSTGIATGLEMAILDRQGNQLPPGITGEIALQGPRIFKGYENNPEANARAFINGWFLTGDLGYRDEEGYLFLVGRIKEMINRGGEKVSPREIEEALLSGPGVADAIAFSLPDPALGETVGAAVVLKGEHRVTAADLKKHVSGRLAYFKVPARLWIVDEIPKGPTGKIQRIGMFDRLKGLAAADDNQTVTGYVPPDTPTEKILAGIWAEVLQKDRIGRDDNFLDLGGDSLLATMVISRIGRTFALKITIASVIDCDTIARLGEFVDRRLNGEV